MSFSSTPGFQKAVAHVVMVFVVVGISALMVVGLRLAKRGGPPHDPLPATCPALLRDYQQLRSELDECRWALRECRNIPPAH